MTDVEHKSKAQKVLKMTTALMGDKLQLERVNSEGEIYIYKKKKFCIWEMFEWQVFHLKRKKTQGFFFKKGQLENLFCHKKIHYVDLENEYQIFPSCSTTVALKCYVGYLAMLKNIVWPTNQEHFLQANHLLCCQ